MLSVQDRDALVGYLEQSGAVDSAGALRALLVVASLNPSEYDLTAEGAGRVRAINLVAALAQRDPAGQLLAQVITALQTWMANSEAVPGLAAIAARLDGPTNQPTTLAVRLHPALPQPLWVLGREELRQTLVSRMQAADGKVVLIYGVGGSGKTTLAARVARDLAGTPFRLIVWSSAAGLPTWGLQQLLNDFAVLVPEIGQPPTEERQAAVALDYLRSSPTLLVCDYLDSLAANAPEQDKIARFTAGLDPTQGSRVLITVRETAGWLSDLISQPGVLPPVLVEGLAPEAAVQFLRRLGAAKQIPALAQAPDAELLPLVRAVAYNPKLIELLVGLRDYARIQRVAAALPANLARARDQLLAEALTRVQETPGALALLQQMPVFSQAADYAAVQAVGGPGLPAGSTFDDALDASLTTALLVTDSAPDGRVRYRLPPLVQGYLTVAPALAPPPQLLAAVSRHMSYFAEFALAHQQPDAYPALVQAWPNLRAGWAAADLLRQRAVAANNPTTAGQAAQYLLAYGLALHDFVLLRGLWTEGRPLLTASATAARETGEDRYEFPILLDLAKIVEEQGDPAAARGMYERCLAIARAHDDPAAGAVALHRLGIVAAEAGQVETARRYYDESLAAARQAGNTESESATLHQLAILDAAAGDVAQAHRRYAESLALAQHIGDVQGEARTLHQLATLNAQAGDVPAARAGYEQSLQLKRTIGDVQGEAASEVMLGKLLFDQGDHAAGLALLRAGVATYQGLGSLRELQQADALLQARLAAMSSPTHPQGDAGGGAAPTPPDPAGQVSA